jgi:hypothetical protein
VIGEINDEWLEGKCRGITGMFPKVFVTDDLSYKPGEAEYDGDVM